MSHRSISPYLLVSSTLASECRKIRCRDCSRHSTLRGACILMSTQSVLSLCRYQSIDRSSRCNQDRSPCRGRSLRDRYIDQMSGRMFDPSSTSRPQHSFRRYTKLHLDNMRYPPLAQTHHCYTAGPCWDKIGNLGCSCCLMSKSAVPRGNRECRCSERLVRSFHMSVRERSCPQIGTPDHRDFRIRSGYIRVECDRLNECIDPGIRHLESSHGSPQDRSRSDTHRRRCDYNTRHCSCPGCRWLHPSRSSNR
jgi:hypothetical protein